MKRLGMVIGASLVLSTAAGGADAQSMQYTISGAYTASFVLDETPAPSAFNDFSFNLSDVEGAFQHTGDPVEMVFWSSSNGGGINIESSKGGLLVQSFGPQLYSGSTASPVLLAGDFVENGGENQSYFISAVPVPEPSTGALFLAGIMGVGIASGVRARRRG